MFDQDKKEEGLFIKVYHELISFKELKEDLNEITQFSSGIDKKKLSENFCVNNISAKNLAKPVLSNQSASLKSERNQSIKFKMEPCILHVVCNDLKDAQKLYNKAKLAGWKKSGMIASTNRIILELNSTERLEFPVIEGERVIVSDEFLKIIVKKSNENLKKSWRKIERFEKSI